MVFQNSRFYFLNFIPQVNCMSRANLVPRVSHPTALWIEQGEKS